MTESLQKAIERLRQLPDERQDALARLPLNEMEEDERWSESTAAHSHKLSGLVEKILSADERGECE